MPGNVDLDERCAMLLDSLANYRATVSPFYDEPLVEVIDEVDRRGSVGKSELGILHFWKRIPRGGWTRDLLVMSDEAVRAVTARAVLAARDTDLSVAEAARVARSELTSLPGMRNGDAYASTVIFVAAPSRMAVFDRRARTGLRLIGLPLNEDPGRYGRYMGLIERCRVELELHASTKLTAREIDLALFHLAKHVPDV